MIWGQISPAQETEGQSRQRVGGGRSFWLLCVVVVFCGVARMGRIFVRESKCFMVEQNLILFYPWCYYATQKYQDMRRGICRTYVRYGTKMYGLDVDFIITLPLGLSAFLVERDVSLLHQKKLIGLLVCIHHVCVYCLCKATEAKVVRMGGYLVFPTGNKVLCNM